MLPSTFLFDAYHLKCECSGLSEFISSNYDKRKFGTIVNEYLYKKNLTTTELSENAGIDRKLTSKFVSDDPYHPSKDTSLAVCIGLGLNSREARKLLKLAGYSFAENSRRDLVVLYALDAGVCHISEVNGYLKELGEKPFKE